jgi:acyl carrier protein
MTNSDTLAAVRAAVVESLDLDESEVTPDATLMVDLGAESIDFLDILFRVDRKTGIRMKVSEIRTTIMGGMSLDDFRDADGFVTPQGIAQVQRVMPHVKPSADERIEARLIARLITVQDLANFVAERGRVPVA